MQRRNRYRVVIKLNLSEGLPRIDGCVAVSASGVACCTLHDSSIFPSLSPARWVRGNMEQQPAAAHLRLPFIAFSNGAYVSITIRLSSDLGTSLDIHSHSTLGSRPVMGSHLVLGQIDNSGLISHPTRGNVRIKKF